MMQPPQLIVMLTYNDHTVLDAAEIFARCKDSKAEFWGFKEAPLPLEQMKMLYRSMKDAGKTTFLEVVEYTVGLSNICYTLCRKLFRVSLGDFQPSGLIGKLLYFLL